VKTSKGSRISERSPMESNLAVIILAAGQGKRLGGESQKVVKKIFDKPILLYLISTIEKLSHDRIIVVVGFGKEEVFEQLRGRDVEYVEQEILRGTGDAVLQTRGILEGYKGNILILCGDVPFITLNTLKNLVAKHAEDRNCGTILTFVLDNPVGYGRIKRDSSGSVVSIVEEPNATEMERRIKEVNAGIYVFEKKILFSALEKVLPDRVKKEYYLTDVVEILSSQGRKIGVYTTMKAQECMGINNVQDIEKARQYLLGKEVLDQ